MSDEWLRAVRANAERIAALDARQAMTEMERLAITEAQVIVQLVAEIARMKQQRDA